MVSAKQSGCSILYPIVLHPKKKAKEYRFFLATVATRHTVHLVHRLADKRLSPTMFNRTKGSSSDP